MIHPSLHSHPQRIEQLCRKYRIRELCVFGSATRVDFGPESDVDLLVEFEPGLAPRWAEFFDMVSEFKDLFGRDVDVVEGRASLINPFRRRTILRSLERLYAA